MKMRLRSKKSDRAVLGDVSNKRSASKTKLPSSPPSDPSTNQIIPEVHTLQYADAIHTNDVLSLDKRDLRDPLLVANYASDLYQGFFRAQDKCCASPYMDMQADINSKMRAILIDWLIEVHMKFKLVPETLYLCVNIIDRYCETKTVPRAKLQLVGVTALLIACKYEEIYPPEVRDCVYITDNAYTRQEVLDMEQDMLETLQFHITVPTAYPFLVRYLSIIRAGSLIKIASNYYTERTLQEHDMLKFPPSLVSCASVFLAFNNEEINDVDDTLGYPQALKEYSGYSLKEVQECAVLIAKKVGEEPVTASRRQLVAVKKKYASDKYRNISENYSNPSIEGSIE
ncbi:hypothetical protein TrLO_g6316 [Triparma laevis f. longispina]|uniref:Cyclin N-terminal domain-containing protein n=1 Tax=Triparma laevis f. longispina TaxID=1714387 RepID=A0A9W7FSF0_9STRA|nr:hypothetical protein TrLO_g6316 [Triparma laevis f. longispina]